MEGREEPEEEEKLIESGAEVLRTMKPEAPFGGRESIVGRNKLSWTCVIKPES